MKSKVFKKLEYEILKGSLSLLSPNLCVICWLLIQSLTTFMEEYNKLISSHTK